MEILNIISEDNGKDLSFNIKNIELPYLNGITRIIMSDIPSYAFSHIEIIHNDSVINNTKITKKIEIVPIDKPIGFVISVKNDTNCKVHVTTSDMKLYNINDSEFKKYLSGLKEKRYKNRVKQYEKHGINIESYTENEEEDSITKELKDYLEDNKDIIDTNLEDLIQKDLQIVTLDIDDVFEVYGVSIPGIPSDHVKWQQGFGFKKQCKNVKKSETFKNGPYKDYLLILIKNQK